jgi:hypothetical protein
VLSGEYILSRVGPDGYTYYAVSNFEWRYADQPDEYKATLTTTGDLVITSSRANPTGTTGTNAEMKSGYGIEAKWKNVKVNNASVSNNSTTAPGFNSTYDITPIQSVMMLFPESRYTTTSSAGGTKRTVPASFRLLRAHGQGLDKPKLEGKTIQYPAKSYDFAFAANPFSTYFAKGGADSETLTWPRRTSMPTDIYALASMVHYTPIWFPGEYNSPGTYTVYGYMLDAWTPGGMLSKADNAKITIKGNLWDDWHVSPVWPDERRGFGVYPLTLFFGFSP